MLYTFVSAQAEHEGVISHAFIEQVWSTWAWYSTHVLFVIDFPINVLICNWEKKHPLHRDRTAFPYQKVSLLLFSVLTQCLTQPSSVNSWRALVRSQLMQPRSPKELFTGLQFWMQMCGPSWQRCCQTVTVNKSSNEAQNFSLSSAIPACPCGQPHSPVDANKAYLRCIRSWPQKLSNLQLTWLTSGNKYS